MGNGLPLVKPFKDFWDYSVLGKTPPPPRGRVDPHSTSVIQPPSAPQEPLPVQPVFGDVDMINANAIVLEAMAKAEVEIPPQPRRQGPPPPPQQGTVDPYAGNTVCSGAVKVVALEDFKEAKAKAKPGDNQWSSWRGYLDSISLERVEKSLRRFMAMFKAPEAVDPHQDRTRGRMTPHEPDCWDKKAIAVANRAKRGVRPGMGVYRARAGRWEDFKDAQVKPGDGDASVASS